MADPLALDHRRTLLGTLPADGPDPAFVQPQSDYGDTHVLGGATADRKVPFSNDAAADKAEWDWIGYGDSAELLENGTGGGLVQGDVVAFAGSASVALDDTLSSQNHFVVCAEATLASTITGRFWAGAVIPVVKTAGSVTALHYLRKSATTKVVEDTGVAAGPSVQVPSGALGLALSTVVGAGTVSALWFTRPAPLLPPLTAGYLKGTGTGYAVQTTPIPVSDYATGTPTGAKFVRDDGVLAVPPTGSGGSTVLDASATDVIVENTATEGTLYSVLILGGALGTRGRARFEPILSSFETPDLTDPDVQRDLTLRLKLNGTTVWSKTIGVRREADSTVTTGVFERLRALLCADGTHVNQLLVVYTRGIEATGVGTTSAFDLEEHVATTINAAADFTLSLTAQFSVAGAAARPAWIKAEHVLLEGLAAG